MTSTQEVEILISHHVTLTGILNIPPRASFLVIFAHGSGSGRFSPRNQFVAKYLNDNDIATLLLDLLTPAEERSDAVDAHLRFDIPFLSKRLRETAQWIFLNPITSKLRIGYFGASTGAGAALVSASELGQNIIRTVVCRGGRPDLAGSALKEVTQPVLLIVGERDTEVIKLNQEAMKSLPTTTKFEIVKGEHIYLKNKVPLRKLLVLPPLGSRNLPKNKSSSVSNVWNL